VLLIQARRLQETRLLVNQLHRHNQHLDRLPAVHPPSESLLRHLRSVSPVRLARLQLSVNPQLRLQLLLLASQLLHRRHLGRRALLVLQMLHLLSLLLDQPLVLVPSPHLEEPLLHLPLDSPLHLLLGKALHLPLQVRISFRKPVAVRLY